MNDSNQENENLAIATVITEEKVGSAQQEYIDVVIDMCKINISTHHHKKLSQNRIIIINILSFLGIILYSVFLYMSLSVLVSPVTVCGGSSFIGYVLHAIYAIFSVFSVFGIISFIKKIMHSHSSKNNQNSSSKSVGKFTTFIASVQIKRAFTNLRKQKLPLTAHYHINNNELIYTRKNGEDEKNVYQLPLVDTCYYRTENLVVIVKVDAKNIINQYCICFIDENNADTLLEMLTENGVIDIHDYLRIDE